MKSLKSILFLTVLLGTLMSCSNDDDNTPEPVNEEEVITTLIATLAPQGGGTPVVMTSRDLDGDGPNDPTVSVSGNLAANTTYSGTVSVLNETEDPVEDITEEVEEESDEHQFFFVPSAGLNVAVAYENFDGNGNPLGTRYTVTTTDASNGTFTVVLRHEPKKPNDGTLGDAGGETDISVTFDVTIE